jgi:hypothetical protein
MQPGKPRMSFSSVMSVKVARPDAVMQGQGEAPPMQTNIEARRRAERLDEYDP